MSKPLEDYALLSDGQTAALLARDGSVDWLCWPRFDDDACLAALLGSSRNGHWSIAPTSAATRIDRRYQQDTLVMETGFETTGGTVRVVDFLPVGAASPSIIRIVTGLTGEVAMRSVLRLRFDYGAVPPWLSLEGDTVTATVGPDRIVLRTDAPLELDRSGDVVESTFSVKAGERFTFVMRYGRSDQPNVGPIDADAELHRTQQFWRSWIGQFDNGKTRWPNEVRRSLLTLKATIHQPTGGLIAAPTTSLPEVHGGTANWDYRFCWLRDASFAMVTLLNAGFHDEVKAWRDWLLRAIAGTPEHIGVLYRVDGARHADERTIDWLAGYDDSRPVRVGNQASTQRQIDVLGEVLDCLDLARRSGIGASYQEDVVEERIVRHLEKVWDQPGSGIWESRVQPRHYVYARVMAWVAVDRFIAHRHDDPAVDPALLLRLKQLDATIRDDVYRQGWSEASGSFTSYYGSDEIDASLLLLPLVGFLPADDPRMVATIERIQRELTEGGLIRRKRREGNGNDEATFLACSCWMADCLSLLGRMDEARAQFERVLAVANDLDLFSEQYDVQRGCLAGNFPQALTHLAVVNTALGLCGPVLQRGGG